jgi:hypothetical protein
MTTPGIDPAEAEERDRKLDEPERTRVSRTRRAGGI